MDLIGRFVYPHEEDTIGTDMNQYWSNFVGWLEKWSVHIVYGTLCTALTSAVVWQWFEIEYQRELLREAAVYIYGAIMSGCFN